MAEKAPLPTKERGTFWSPCDPPQRERVDKAMKSDAFEGGTSCAQAAGPTWRICRVDIRSPLSSLPGHIARVELEHTERGRVTDMGSALDLLGAALAAVAQILGCKASVISLHSSHRRSPAEGNRVRAMAAIVVECDGRKRRGTASGQDAFYASLAAFIDAVTCADERDCSPLSAGLNTTGDIDLLAARPCQASGVDENGDWWLFASDDEGAAEAIAAEFRDEGYEQVRVSLPKRQLAPDLKRL